MKENMNKKIYGSNYDLMMKTKWSNVLTLKFINSCFNSYCERYRLKITLDNKYIKDIMLINNKIKECNIKRKKLYRQQEILNRKLASKECYISLIVTFLLMLFPIFILFIASIFGVILTHMLISKILFYTFLIILIISLIMIYIYYLVNVYNYVIKNKKIEKRYQALNIAVDKIYSNDLNTLTIEIYNQEIEPLVK